MAKAKKKSAMKPTLNKKLAHFKKAQRGALKESEKLELELAEATTEKEKRLVVFKRSAELLASAESNIRKEAENVEITEEVVSGETRRLQRRMDSLRRGIETIIDERRMTRSQIAAIRQQRERNEKRADVLNELVEQQSQLVNCAKWLYEGAVTRKEAAEEIHKEKTAELEEAKEKCEEVAKKRDKAQQKLEKVGEKLRNLERQVKKATTTMKKSQKVHKK